MHSEDRTITPAYLSDLSFSHAQEIIERCPAIPPTSAFAADDPDLPEKIGAAFGEVFSPESEAARGFYVVAARGKGVTKIERNDYPSEGAMIADCLRGGYCLMIEARYLDQATNTGKSVIVRLIGDLVEIKKSIRRGEWMESTEAKPDVRLTKFSESTILWSDFSKRAKRLIAPLVDSTPGKWSFSQAMKRFGGLPTDLVFSGHMLAYMSAHGYLSVVNTEVQDMLKTVPGLNTTQVESVAEFAGLRESMFAGKKH